MAKTKLEDCQSCGDHTAEYNKEKGFHKCKCGAIWWDSFDKPHGKHDGYICLNCGGKNTRTLQSIARVGSVNIRRCNSCGRTLLQP